MLLRYRSFGCICSTIWSIECCRAWRFKTCAEGITGLLFHSSWAWPASRLRLQSSHSILRPWTKSWHILSPSHGSRSLFQSQREQCGNKLSQQELDFIVWWSWKNQVCVLWDRASYSLVLPQTSSFSLTKVFFYLNRGSKDWGCHLLHRL